MQLTDDNRIILGGGSAPYHYGNRLHPGNHKLSLTALESYLCGIEALDVWTVAGSAAR